MDADTAPFGEKDATPGSRACVLVCDLLGRVGRADLPGAFWCASPFSCGRFVLPLCSAPSGLGSPCLLWYFFFFSFFFVCAPPLCPAFRIFWPGVPWAWASCSPPPFFSPFFFFFFPSPRPGFFFFPPQLCFVRGLFLCFFFSAALFVVFFFAALFLVFFLCRLCGAGSVCVFVAVGCAGVWCCWRCGLMCVVWLAWCCVACLCLAGLARLPVRRAGALGLVGLLLLFSAGFFFCVVPCVPVVVLFFSSVWCSAVVLLAVWLGPVASFLCWLLLRCAVWCSAVL